MEASDLVMIDLTYLTEEEQEAIRAVLNRDAMLKKVEEQRVQNLQRTVSDRLLLRYLTGEWFYETKQLRHQDRIHGCDIIRASMRHSLGPLTHEEPGRTGTEKQDVFCCEKLFIPPQPLIQPGTERCKNQTAHEPGPDPPRLLLQSPSKRKNPFNTEVAAAKQDERPLDGVSAQTPAAHVNCPSETAKDEKQGRPASAECHSVAHWQDVVDPGRHSVQDTHSALTHESALGPGRTREKRSLSLHDEFCEMGLKNTREPHFASAEQNSGKTVYPTAAPEDSQMEELENSMSETRLPDPKSFNSPNECVSNGLLRNFEEKSDQDEEKRAKKEEPTEIENLFKIPAHSPVDKPVIVKQKTAEVKMLHLSALQKNPFNDTVSSVGTNTQREETLGPPRLCHLGTPREGGSRPSRLILMMEDLNDEDECKSDMTDSCVNQISSGVTNWSPDMEMKEEDVSEESPWTGGRFLADVSNDGDSYRANPILIYEDTDESLENSLTDIKPEEPILSGDPGTPGPYSNPFSSTPEKGPTSVINLKHFWENEKPGPDITPVKVKEAKSGSPLPLLSSSDITAELEGATQALQTVMAEVQKFQKLSDPGPDTYNDLKQAMTETESVERSCIHAKQYPRSANDDEDDVQRSPSKTCHPKVLPRDPSTTSRSRLEGSPLKTFPIDIDSNTKVNIQRREKFSPPEKHTKSPPQASKTLVADHGTDVSSPSRPQQLKAFSKIGQQNASMSSKQSLQEMPDSVVYLARSFTPQNFQHYLGPEEKTHSPPFDEDHISAESVPRLQSRCSQPASRSPEWVLPSSSVRNTNNNSNQDVPGPSSSLPWTPSRISSLPSLEQMRSSVSVPACLQDETDSDGTLESIGFYRRNTSSSTSNMSSSSGLASMASVSGSLTSMEPADCPEVEVQGNIQFAVNYIQKLQEFHIFVVLCRGLAIADSKKSRSDPYVKCYLLPDKTKLGKRKTSVKKKTLNPTYNEILRFKVLMEVLKTQSLSVSVWHHDTFGRNSFLGEVDLDLSEWDFSNTQINDYTLKAQVSGPMLPSHLIDSRGQMRVALRFLPQTSHSKRSPRMEAGEVQIWIKDCRNLPPGRGIVIDPFVKCAVLPDTSRKSRQKTRVVKRTASPMFNHTMVFDGFRPEDLQEACAEITVWDHDRLNSHYVGGLRLGPGTGKSYGAEVSWMDSNPEEASLWRRMLQAPGEWVESILPLRMLLMAKNM